VRLSKRLDGIAESVTLKLNAAVQTMKAQGIDVVNLTAGEPDFNVPEAAKKAAIEAVQSNKSKYTAVAGIVELRQAIADKTNRQQPEVTSSAHGPWKPEHIVVTNGGKQSLFNIFMAMLDERDEVLIPSPYWLSYPEMVRIAGATPRFIETTFSQNFKITPDQLRSALKASGGRARILIMNSPSNPTGAVYSRAELKALGEVLKSTPEARDLWVVSDEIYDRIVFTDEPFVSFLSAVPEWAHQTVTVNGMSKSAAMTGWRVGWTVAPKELTQALITLQGQCTSGINAPAQWASVAGLKIPEAEFASQVQSFRSRRDLCLDILKKAGKIEVFAPGGAFYLFVGVGEDSVSFAERLLEKAKVAVVPGTPFGAPNYIRLSYATDERSLKDGCERIVKFLS
jgi:aspartate aminotransferase